MEKEQPALTERKQIRIKLITAGDSCVGKSCLIKRFCEKKFVSKYISTIGIDFGVRLIPVTSLLTTNYALVNNNNKNNNNKDNNNQPDNSSLFSLPFSFPLCINNLHIHFFDLSGNLAFSETRYPFYSDSQILFFLFDPHKKETFDHLNFWIEEWKNSINSKAENFIDPVVAIVASMVNEVQNGTAIAEGGMNSNRKRVVTEEEGRRWSNGRGYFYFETSAKTGENVDKLFIAVLQAIVQRIPPPPKKFP